MSEASDRARPPRPGDALYSAAERAVEDGRVLEARVLQGGKVVTGIVAGETAASGGPAKFRVYIRNHAARSPTENMEAECSCGERALCVHVLAVSIVATKSGGAGTAAQHRSRPVHNIGGSSQNTAVQQLCYVIDTPTDTQGEPHVSTWVAQRASEVGSVVPGSACLFAPRTSRSASSTSDYPRYVDNQDREILHVLSEPGPAGSWGLRGETGASVLLRMASTGRAYRRSPDGAPIGTPALRPGASLKVVFAWQLLPGGEQVLSWEGAGSLAVLCGLEPPIYIDTIRNVIGPVELAFDSRVLREFAQHLPIAPEQIAAVNARLEKVAAGPAFPRLGSVRPTKVALTSLTPRLVLSADEQALLYFVYNGTPVDSCRLRGPSPDAASGDLVRFISAGTLYEVHRDLDRERVFESQLADALGNTPDGREAWLAFMATGVPKLQAAGWEVTPDEGFPYRIVTSQQWYGDLGADLRRSAWFNLRLGVMVDGRPVNLLPALTRYLQSSLTGTAQHDLVADAGGCRVGDVWMTQLDDGRYLPIPLERIERIANTLVELFDRDSLIDGDLLALPRSQGGRLAQLAMDLNGPALTSTDTTLAALLEDLKSFAGIQALPPPSRFRGELRQYQQDGLGWLQFLRKFRLGGILADDMGLGKTVQTIAHICLEVESGRLTQPVLIVAPVSALGNWQQELSRFAPTLSVHLWHGAQRRKSLARLHEVQVILTAYPLLLIDSEILLARDYSLLILDEAQMIKNPDAKVSQVARTVRAEHRLCLSGTPVENHLGELWSLFEFLQPGLLGDERHFQRHYRTPIEKNGDRARAAGLSARLAPFLLRRTKDSVAKELPPKIEMVESITLDERQRDFYDAVRLAMHQRIQEIIREQGLARSQITILDALLKLRQVCCDPRLVDREDARDVPSAKLEWITTVLPELVAEGRRILLFSQFTSMLRLLERAITDLGIPYCLLTGETQDRSAVVKRFQSGEVPLFLISLKAGGTALNLTAADTVIHYDPWWNPAVEAQATDRAHRIGQTKSVFVYKLITQDTVEERMLQLQADKRVLAGQLYTEKSAAPTALTAADIEKLLGSE